MFNLLIILVKNVRLKILQKSLPFTTSLLSKYFSGSFRYQLNKITRVTELASSPFKEQLLHKKPYTALHNIKELTKDLSNQIKVEEYFLLLTY